MPLNLELKSIYKFCSMTFISVYDVFEAIMSKLIAEFIWEKEQKLQKIRDKDFTLKDIQVMSVVLNILQVYLIFYLLFIIGYQPTPLVRHTKSKKYSILRTICKNMSWRLNCILERFFYYFVRKMEWKYYRSLRMG